MDRNQTLDTAKAAVNRAPKSYGNPREHFERVARHWSAHLQGISAYLVSPPPRLKPEDVAIMLGLVKIARLEHDPQHADSWCDLAGYAACGAEVSEPAVDYKVTIKTGEINPNTAWRGTRGSGYIAEFFAKPGETLHEAADRAVREGYVGWTWMGAATGPGSVRILLDEPKQEPAWKRAKVGDRIRIREGATNNSGFQKFPNIGVVKEVQSKPKDRRCVVGANWVHNDDVLEILPPLPESKFGFTVGETVNASAEVVGRKLGIVAGFNADGILIQWPWEGATPGVTWYPNELRHGA